MKFPRHKVKKLEEEMISHAEKVIKYLFPDKRPPANANPVSIPFDWNNDGESETYWAPMAPDGSFFDAISGSEIGIWELWKSKKGNNDISAAAQFYLLIGKDPLDVLPATFSEARRKLPSDVRNVDAVMSVAGEDDLSSLIGFEKRFLGQAGSWVIVGPSGVGKSSLTMHLAAHLSAGKEWFGIAARRPLNVLVVQQENDDGDLSEMLSGAMDLWADSIEESRNVRQRLGFWHTEVRGAKFCEELQERIIACNTDIVLLDPLLAQIAGDVSSQEVVAGFLRQQFQPVLSRTGALAIVVHHTGKPSETRSVSKRDPLELSYSGIGSSEITNWARAIAVLSPAGNKGGIFRFTIAKRRGRSGLKSKFTGCIDEVFLQHASKGMGWTEVAPPQADPKGPRAPASLPVQNDQLTTLVFTIVEAAGGKLEMGTLIHSLAERTGKGLKTTKTKVTLLLKKGVLRVSNTEAREGGGHPLKFIEMG